MHCSFCGKHIDDVFYLIAGPDVYICNECVVLCVDIIFTESEKKVKRLVTESLNWRKWTEYDFAPLEHLRHISRGTVAHPKKEAGA